MTSKKETLLLILLFLLLFSSVLLAEYLRADSPDRTYASGGSAPASSDPSKGADAVSADRPRDAAASSDSVQDAAAASSDPARDAAAAFSDGGQDPAADTGKGASASVPFKAEDVLWEGGMPACDAASATVYIPWEMPAETAPSENVSAENGTGTAPSGNVSAEKKAAASENVSAEKGAGAAASENVSAEKRAEIAVSENGSAENGEEAAAAFRKNLLEALVPADPRGRIELAADDLQRDPAAAMREGHSFFARLVKPEGTAQFQIVLTGLPVLCLQKTDAQEITYKEEHDGLVRLMASRSADGKKTGSAPASEETFPCSFHVRGNVSSTLEKKPYKLSLKDAAGDQEKVSWLDLRRDDDWILNPLYTDATRVREMTAYALWDEVSFFAETPVPSSRMRYVELFIDDAWQGIYGLMEPVDRKQLGLSPGDLLYKIDRWNREYPYLDLYDGAEEAQDLEICNDYGFPCVELRYPKSWDRTATWGPMQAFHEFSFRTYDSGTLATARLVPDMDSVLSLSLFCAMTHAMDNNWKNSFLIASKHTPGENTGGGEEAGGGEDTGGGEDAGDGDLLENGSYEYVLYRTIWDMNYIFGDVFVYEPENRYTAFDMDTASAYTPYEDSTCDFEAFLKADSGSGEDLQKALRRKWAAWRSGGISADSIISAAQGHLERLRQSGALGREMQGWPQDENCDRAMEEMEDWIRRRFAYLDERFW